MTSITLRNRGTGETVTFPTLTAASKALNVGIPTLTNLRNGEQKTVAKKRYELAETVARPKDNLPSV